MNRLLQRQVNKYLHNANLENAELQAFLKAIDDAYRNYEDQYQHIERALELSSNELFKINRELKKSNEGLEELVQLRTKEVERLAMVARKTQNAVIIADAEGKAIWANEGFTRITGYSIDEVIGKIPGRLLQGPLTSIETRREIAEAIQAKKPFDGEIYNYSKNGEGYWLSLSITPITDDNQEHIGFIAIESDITENKKQQLLIEESEARFRFVINSLKEVVFQTNQQNQWTFLNPAWEEITGFPIESSLGTSIRDYLDPSEIENCQNVLVSILSKKEEYGKGVFKFRVKNGQIRFLEVFVRLTIDSSGEIKGLSGTLNDVTEKVEAEQKLNETLVTQTAILNSTHNAKIAFDHSGKIKLFNRGAERILGYTSAEVLGQINPAFFFNPKDLERISLELCLPEEVLHENPLEILILAGMSKKRDQYEYNITRKDGSQTWISISVSPLINHENVQEGYLLIATDISDRREANEKLTITQTLIDHSSDAIQISDEDGNFIFVNTQSANNLKYTREELLTKNIREVEEIFTAPGSWENHVNELKEKGKIMVQGINIRSNGEQFPIEANVHYSTINGKGYVMAMIRDISERKKTEEEIIKKQMLLNKAQAIAQIGSWEYFVESGTLLWSDELYSILEVDKTKPVNMDLYYSLVHPSDVLDFKNSIEKAFGTGREQTIEHRIITTKGTEKYILGIGKPVMGPGNNIIALRGTAQDITQRKLFEHQLLYNEKLLLAVNRISSILLNAQNLSDAIQHGLEIIGETVDTNRVYIFQNHRERGEILTSQRYEWVKGNLGIQLDQPELQNINLKSIGLERWLQAFGRGNPISGLVKNFPESERKVLERQSVQSILTLPIFVNEMLWGFVGFEDCEKDKIWTTSEENILGNLANAIGSSIVREISEKKARTAELIIENSPSVLFRCKAQDNWPFEYITENISQFGYNSDLLQKDALRFSDLILEEDREKFNNEVQEMIKKGNARLSQEFRIRTADGKIRWIDNRSIVERDLRGNISHVSGILMDIDEKKHAEDRLAQSEQRFRSLVQNSSDITTVISLDGTIQYISPSFYRLFGYQETDVLGQNVFGFVHPDDREITITEFMKGVQLGGVSDPVHFRYRKENGDYLFLEAVGNNLVDDNSVGAIVVNSRDISERVRFQEQTLTTKQFYEKILHSIPLDVVVFDENHRYLFANKAAIRDDVKREWIIGKTDYEYCQRYNKPKEIADARHHEFNRMVKGGVLIEFEEKLKDLQGQDVWCLRRFFPAKDENGNLINVIGYGLDITERKLAEESLKILSDRLQLATEAAGFGVWDWHLQSNELVWDNTLYTLFGVKAEDFEGTFDAWANTLLQEDQPKALEDVNDAIAGTRPFASEFRIHHRLLGVRYIAARAKVYRDENGTATRMLGVNWDITDSKIAEQKLIEYTQDLEKINKELDQFAYVVSHDLKAPLRAINNLSLWIEEDLDDKLEGDTREQFNLLRGRVARMEGLINGILNYSRAGRVRTTPTQIDMNQFVPDIINLLAPPHHFQVHIQSHLPEIYTEKVALEQVFSNFISNAIKYNDKAEAKIEITCEDVGKFWKFGVHDNGPGIEKEFYDKVFVIFQTLNARDKVESTGVGLAIVKKIIEDRGGSVWIESEMEVGTTFYFTWPK